MPDIKDILKNEDFGSIVGDLCVDTRENRNPREYMEEYDGDRTRRKESVGYREPKKIAVYSETEKEVDPDTGEEKPRRLEDKTVEVAQIVTNLPKKIVRTSVAFLFGGEMTITAEDPNNGFTEFKNIYKLAAVYQLVSLKIAATRSTYLHIGYSLQNFRDPNFLMLGVGYRFNNKYPRHY